MSMSGGHQCPGFRLISSPLIRGLDLWCELHVKPGEIGSSPEKKTCTVPATPNMQIAIGHSRQLF